MYWGGVGGSPLGPHTPTHFPTPPSTPPIPLPTSLLTFPTPQHTSAVTPYTLPHLSPHLSLPPPTPQNTYPHLIPTPHTLPHISPHTVTPQHTSPLTPYTLPHFSPHLPPHTFPQPPHSPQTLSYTSLHISPYTFHVWKCGQRWAVSRYLYRRYVSSDTFVSISVSIMHVFVHRRCKYLNTVFEQDQSYRVLTACSFTISEESEMKLNSLIDSKRRTVRKFLLSLAYLQLFRNAIEQC